MVNGLILTVHSPFLLDFIAAHLFAALTLAQVLANFPAGHTAKFRLTNLKFKSIFLPNELYHLAYAIYITGACSMWRRRI